MRPDYDRLYDPRQFSVHVGGSQGALRELTETPIRDFNLDPAACADCFRRGRPMMREMFGEGVALPGVSTPAISYGHVAELGSELIFPDGGEVSQTHIYGSLEEGLAALAQPVTWGQGRQARYFLDFWEQMKAAFPDEPVGWSWGAEGPLTTAYELRGDGWFMDFFDQPELAQEFLAAVTESALDFNRHVARVHGRPTFGPAAGLCDDLAALIPARLFPQFVMPYWERWFAAQTNGARSAHVEDLRVEQLPYLEEIGLSSYDPSISPRLHPQLIKAHCRVPFTWRLGEIHYHEMSVAEVTDFVFQAAADGASSVHGVVAETMCNEATVPKVLEVLRAGQEVKDLLAAGCSREELAQRVSPAGREQLWEGWNGFLSPRSSRGGARVAVG